MGKKIYLLIVHVLLILLIFSVVAQARVSSELVGYIFGQIMAGILVSFYFLNADIIVPYLWRLSLELISNVKIRFIYFVFQLALFSIVLAMLPTHQYNFVFVDHTVFYSSIIAAWLVTSGGLLVLSRRHRMSSSPHWYGLVALTILSTFYLVIAFTYFALNFGPVSAVAWKGLISALQQPYGGIGAYLFPLVFQLLFFISMIFSIYSPKSSWPVWAWRIGYGVSATIVLILFIKVSCWLSPTICIQPGVLFG